MLLQRIWNLSLELNTEVWQSVLQHYVFKIMKYHFVFEIRYSWRLQHFTTSSTWAITSARFSKNSSVSQLMLPKPWKIGKIRWWPTMLWVIPFLMAVSTIRAQLEVSNLDNTRFSLLLHPRDTPTETHRLCLFWVTEREKI